MKDNEKKVNTTEEAKKDIKVKEYGEKLTDEEMEQVTGGGIVRKHESNCDNIP